jgi:glutamine amidotransferase
MCRFVAYLGEKPIILSEVLQKPSNSLVKQSKNALEGKLGLNADGFGVSWYNHNIDQEPGLFRSIQPAWSDENLYYLSKKISSKCFLGHVRASTVGNVNILNCHPFVHKQFSFVHNGTVRDFNLLKKKLINNLSEEAFDLIKGQTDSEHLFTLIIDILSKQNKSPSLNNLYLCFYEAIEQIKSLKNSIGLNSSTKINSVFTDGHRLIATRYISTNNSDTLSLYYSTNNSSADESEYYNHKYVLIASEPISDYFNTWHELPINHIMLVNKDLEIEIKKLEC